MTADPTTRTEADDRHCRPTGMLLLSMTLRNAVSVTLLVASLTTLSTSCGQQQPATGASPDSVGGDSPTASVARKVYLATGVGGGQWVRTVLDDERDLDRFPGWFARSDPRAAREITERTKETDFSRNVLVGWSQTTGCSEATDAALQIRSTEGGGSRLLLRLDQPKPPKECLAPHRVIVVFEMARDRLPDEPRFGPEGSAADPAGPATTVAFVRQEPGSASQLPQANGEATEVTTEAQLGGFLSRLPDRGAATVRKQLAADPARSDQRRFGFLLFGCAPTGAALLLSPGRAPLAATTGDENIRCVRAEQYAAVIAVAASLVP